MNLRVADSAGLVAFLHEMISSSGETLLRTEVMEVVEVNGVVFYHGTEPITVGGPFRSIEALVRSEGVRRTRSGHGEPTYEVFEWAGSFFRLGDEGSQRIQQYAGLEEARNGGG